MFVLRNKLKSNLPKLIRGRCFLEVLTIVQSNRTVSFSVFQFLLLDTCFSILKSHAWLVTSQKNLLRKRREKASVYLC